MTPLPPKQGLKHLPPERSQCPFVEVMTPLPPKQGLKQISALTRITRTRSYDTTSTKTRIETNWLVEYVFR